MPRAYVASGTWPRAVLKADAPLSARYALLFTQRLRAGMTDQGYNTHSLGIASKVSRKTIERTLTGEVLPAFGAIARLEDCLGIDLWPGPEMRAGQGKRATREDDLDQGDD